MKLTWEVAVDKLDIINSYIAQNTEGTPPSEGHLNQRQKKKISKTPSQENADLYHKPVNHFTIADVMGRLTVYLHCVAY